VAQLFKPRAFKVRTLQGSSFVMRLDPTHEYCGLQFGRLRVVGHALSTNYKIDWTANGACEPAVGGEMIVHPEPVESADFLGEHVKSWHMEEISHVEEIAVPEELVERVLAKQRAAQLLT
jgi:hypothetical protein